MATTRKPPILRNNLEITSRITAPNTRQKAWIRYENRATAQRITSVIIGCGSRILTVVIEFNLPTPLAAIFRIPPLRKYTDFTAGQQHQLTNVCLGWPAILTCYPIPSARKKCHRPVCSLYQVLTISQAASHITPNFYRERRRWSMHDEHVSGCQPAPSKSQSGRTRLGIPEIPELQGYMFNHAKDSTSH